MDANIEVAPIAIVGISAELPSGEHSHKNLRFEDLFDFLVAKKEAYEKIPSSRLNTKARVGKALGQISTDLGAFLKDIDLFDNVEFGISNHDARAIAVSTRKLLEHSFLALLDSGLDYRGRNVGCYMSGTAFDILSVGEPNDLDARGSFAGIPCMIANKVSYHLDLRGPSIPLDTACSSSLTATHLAVQALRAGECEAAIVGGCQVNMRVADILQYSQGSVLSPDGKSKPFDASANGFSRGEGVVSIVLKPYDKAIRDGDFVYGKILGTGINSCGLEGPPYAPIASAQMEAMQRAYANTGKSPAQADFVELHATGTAVGDPVEANWVGEAFRRDGELTVGSIKGNLGHLEITAFLASLCKVIAMFHRRVIPPNVDIPTLNPAIRWETLRMKVPTRPTPVAPISPDGQLLVSICGSGIGGANGHVVVQSMPSGRDASQEQHPQEPAVYPILWITGGLTPRSASANSDAVVDSIKGQHIQDLGAMSVTLGRRSRQLTWRSFAVQHAGDGNLKFSEPVLMPRTRPPLVMVFSGQGPQHINMGRQLFKRYPMFRDTVRSLDEYHVTLTGVSLVRDWRLFDGDVASEQTSIWPINITLPALALVQIALFDLLSHLGYRPDAVVAHSAGEAVLLYASGAGTKEMAFDLSIARGKAMSLLEKSETRGTMAALSCAPAVAQNLINAVVAETQDRSQVLDLGCYNATNAVTVSGHRTLVEAVVQRATRKGHQATTLRTNVPVHSALMEECAIEYARLIADVYRRHPGSRVPRITTYSSAKGATLECFEEDYWWYGSRNPVRFTQTMKKILQDHPGASFVELSPHPVLSHYISTFGVSPSLVTCPMRRTKTPGPHHEVNILMTALGQLTMMGHNSLNFSVLQRSSALCNGDLPLISYPFQQKVVDVAPSYSRSWSNQIQPRNGRLNYPDIRVNNLTHPELADHVINQEPIMPASGFIEMVLEAEANVLWNVEFMLLFSLSSKEPVPVGLTVEGKNWTVTSQPVEQTPSSSPASSLHARGCMSSRALDISRPKVDIAGIQARCTQMDTNAFYKGFEYFAQYGPMFRLVKQAYFGSREFIVQVEHPDSSDDYVFHPATLDAAIHALVHPMFTSNGDSNVYYLPSRIKSLIVFRDDLRHALSVGSIYAHATLKQWTPTELITDLTIADENGDAVVCFHDFVVKKHHILPPRDISKRFEYVYQPLGLDPLRVRGKDFEYDLPWGDTTSASQVERMLERLLTLVSVASHKRTLSVLCVDCGAGTFNERMKEIVSRFPAFKPAYIHIDGGESTSGTLQAKVALLESSVDVVIAFHALSSQSTIEQDYRSLVRPLVPGGVLALVSDDDLDRPISPVSPDAWCPDMFVDVAPRWKALVRSLPVQTGGALNDTVEDSLHEVHLLVGQAPSVSIRHFADDYESANGRAISEKQPVANRPGRPLHSDPNVRILCYRRGGEMALQRQLKDLDINKSTTIWITATTGTLDESTARGLTRSLRREFPLWKIFFASLDKSIRPPEAEAVLQACMSIAHIEEEISIDCYRRILVPRICESPTPSHSTPATPNSTLSAHKQIRSAALLVNEDDVCVEVVACASVSPGLYGVVGRIREAQGESSTGVQEVTVATVVAILPSQFMVARRDALALVDDVTAEEDLHVYASTLPSLLAGKLTMQAVVPSSRPTKSKRTVWITHSSTLIAQHVQQYLSSFDVGVKMVEMSEFASISAGEDIRPGDVIVTGYGPDDALFQAIVPSSAKQVSWHPDSLLGLVASSTPSWMLGSLSQAALDEVDLATLRDFQLVPAIAVAPAQGPLYKPDQTYVLIGGVGSLGIHLSLWLYEHGARSIVLTSRSGRKSLLKSQDKLAMMMLEYLESREDLIIQLKASDGTSEEAMSDLVSSLPSRLAGVFLLSVVLSDSSFFSLDEEKFAASQRAKVTVFDILRKTVDLDGLDFVASLSSISTFGNAGQCGYSSANTALESMVNILPNGFSIVSPAIKDTVSIVEASAHFQHLLPWAFSAQEVCACIDDGIRNLRNMKVATYIPDLDWKLVHEHMGSSSLYNHLVLGKAVEAEAPSSTSSKSRDLEIMKTIVIQAVDVPADEFDETMPLTSFGLDSLSAARLSFTLRGIVPLSQVQLLSNITFRDIVERYHQHAQTETLPPTDSHTLRYGYEGSSLTKISDGEGDPFILLHGANGTIATFTELRPNISGPLWALQATTETPLHSVAAAAAFYYQRIKETFPNGPYRLGGYSGTCFILFALAQLMEASGDQVSQLVMIDHFPSLFVSQIYAPDEETLRKRAPSDELVKRTIRSVLPLYRADSTQRQQLADELEQALSGKPVSPFMTTFHRVFSDITVALWDFSYGLVGRDAPLTQQSLEMAMEKWLQRTQAPVTMVFASNGVLTSIPESFADRQWIEERIRRALPQATIIDIPGTHHSIFRDKPLADIIDQRLTRSA